MIYNRYKDADWFGQPVDIILGGAGGIGSWVALLAARLQYRMVIFDYDTIEEHNVGTQFYTSQQSKQGQKKIDAVVANCMNFGGDPSRIFGRNMKYDGMVSDVMISGFDNMKARKEFFEAWKEYVTNGEGKNSTKPKIFIDGRMSAEEGMIYFVKTKKDIEMYETTLFDDNEVEDGPCSYKATPHTGPFIASIMVSGLVNRVFNKTVGMDVREIPFEFSFNIPEFRFEQKTTYEYYKSFKSSGTETI